VTRSVRGHAWSGSGHEQQEQWFYLRDAGPSRWLKVVVLYDHDKGSIVTAFARHVALC
jgi:hypothetical protein